MAERYDLELQFYAPRNRQVSHEKSSEKSECMPATLRPIEINHQTFQTLFGVFGKGQPAATFSHNPEVEVQILPRKR